MTLSNIPALVLDMPQLSAPKTGSLEETFSRNVLPFSLLIKTWLQRAVIDEQGNCHLCLLM